MIFQLTYRIAYAKMDVGDDEMTSVNITNARQSLYKLVRETNESHEPIHISSKDGGAVLISESDWRSIEETLYIMSVPGLAEAIIEGAKEPLDEMPDALELSW